MVVSVENLSFRYRKNRTPTLNIPQWSVESGERVFIQGPSGSGKSTLLNLLSGILLPNTGHVKILGKALNTLRGSQRDKWRARHIGVVFQQFNLIPYLNAIDNIRLAAHFAGTPNAQEKAHHLLTTLNISRHQRLQPTAQLSIGQQQRVAIARAFINQPQLLIVDEPTSALDHKNRDDFLSLLLSQVKQNKTALIFVGHDHSLSKSFTRIEHLSEINQIADQH